MKHFKINKINWIFIFFSIVGSQAIPEPAAAGEFKSSPGIPVISTTGITTPDKCSLTLGLYRKISIGMTRGLVEEILCGPGILISSTSGNGDRFTVKKWEGDNYIAIILAFKNDKVITRSQVGLK